VERYSQRINDLEKTIDRLTLDINAAEAKRKAAENRLMAEESVWKTERTALEDRLKKVSRFAQWRIQGGCGGGGRPLLAQNLFRNKPPFPTYKRL